MNRIKENFKSVFRKDRDITTGSVSGNIIALALPLMIGALLHSTQSLIDMFWVGSLGPNPISAVAISGTVIMFVFTMSLGIGIGTLSLVAKNVGAGERRGAGLVASQSIFLAFLLGLAAAIAGFYFSGKFLSILGADKAVLAAGTNYLRILLMGSITMILLFTGTYILQGAGDVVNPMIFFGLSNIFNIILDPIFIFGIGVPKMGVSGAALATVLGQGISTLLVLRLLCKKDAKVTLADSPRRIRFDIIKDMLKIGAPYSFQMFFRAIMYMVIISLVATYGMKAVAAFGIVMRIHVGILMPSFALGGAAAMFMGQNLGAKKPERARQSVWTAAKFDLAIMFVVSLLFFKLAHPIISIFSKDAALLNLGADFLRISSLFYIFVAFGIVLNRGMGGAGDTVVPMIITFLALWGYLVPMAFFLSNHTALGLRGVLWAMATSNAVHAVMTIMWFETGRWRKRRIEIY